jgi:pyruvate kinase
VRVLEAGADRAEVEVVSGEALSDRKGVAVPGAVIPLSALTEKDRPTWRSRWSWGSTGSR